MSTALFTISHVSLPASLEDISSYATMRLTALTTNPEAFGTSFARESADTPEIWRSRINAHERTTLAAIKASDNREWIGTLSILWPEMLFDDPKGRISYPLAVKEAEDNDLYDIYMLVGVWVHPGYRRKGVGRELIEQALQVIKLGSPSGTSADSEREGKKRVVLLEACKDNVAAKRLYEKAGFIGQEEGSIGGGSVGKTEWMSMTVN